jgi:hypothetical protein
MVEVTAGEQRQVVSCFGRTITVGVDTQQGVLTVSLRGLRGRRATPLPVAYVKVFQKKKHSSEVCGCLTKAAFTFCETGPRALL